MVRSLIDALHAVGPTPEHAREMSLYAWLVGRWQMEAVVHLDDGSGRTEIGEIHAGWVLEGRAIQDVWIAPGLFYGTTLRVYDPKIDAWHIIWSDPLDQYHARQIGRAAGDDIVQLGRSEAGDTVRWSFTEITPDSFHWLGERSPDQGETWQLRTEFFARRTNPRSDDRVTF